MKVFDVFKDTSQHWERGMRKRPFINFRECLIIFSMIVCSLLNNECALPGNSSLVFATNSIINQGPIQTMWKLWFHKVELSNLHKIGKSQNFHIVSIISTAYPLPVNFVFRWNRNVVNRVEKFYATKKTEKNFQKRGLTLTG